MYKLFIDTTDRKNNEIKLYKDAELIDSIFGEVDIVSSIKKILTLNKIKLSDIDSFDMNEGPGSFTGLKVGAAIVNTLNWVLLRTKDRKMVIPKYSASKFDTLSLE